jgi:hypothetical protein
MTKKEMIRIALCAINKNMSFETLKYSDYMYGKEILTDEVWEYVTEASDMGMIWFNKTYNEYLN